MLEWEYLNDKHNTTVFIIEIYNIKEKIAAVGFQDSAEKLVKSRLARPEEPEHSVPELPPNVPEVFLDVTESVKCCLSVVELLPKVSELPLEPFLTFCIF